MSETLIRGEQLRFVSANTGSHILDTYLEAAEIGGRALADLLEDLFDSSDGSFRADIFEFRESPTDPGVLQFRVGDFVDPNAGWTDITSTDFQAFVVAAQAAQTAAETAETNAAASESTASTSASNAAVSATSAAASATAAGGSASAAATSATNAATSETNAAASASGASTSATNAATSASTAAASETNAATSEANAAVSASAASASATNSANSATASAASETAAATSASNAVASASAAQTAQTSAETAQTAAETAQAATEAAYDLFDARFLGEKATDPTLDNDGNALVAGAIYFNNVSNKSRVYNGATWDDLGIDQAAAAITGGSITGITDLAIQDGGTGASTAAGARANFGLGTSATVNTGTSGAAIPLLNGANTWSSTQTFSAPIRGISGSVSSPGYSFSTDTDTGWYLIGAGLIGYASGGAEVMRIDGSSLLFGATVSTGIDDGSSANPGVYLAGGVISAQLNTGPSLNLSRASSTGQVALFSVNGGGVGSISVTASATTYNTSSDYRLKKDIVDLTGSGEFIESLRPVSFRWKNTGEEDSGFLAHEFAIVSPASVSGTKDETDHLGNPVYQSMQASTPEVIANLVAEVQNLRLRVAQLEAK